MSQTAVEPTRPPTGVVTVSVVQGALRGRKGKTVSGNPMVSFQGIPYAEPPVGPLRFKPPKPASSWTGIRDALQEASQSFHFHPLQNAYVGSEDSLYLNVYTPKLPAERSDLLNPVMVYIHGGGFTLGSGNTEFYGPDYLVDQGVVVVTFNYRLGPLGFLSLENKDAMGNMGLKDQVLALKWVQQNIASFGGNPKEVTIFGESAGGASVHFHVLSPMSKGLFQRAIPQSGTALNWWAVARKPKDRAFRLGHAMGCKTKDPKELIEFLRNAEPQQMYEALEPARTKEERKRFIWFTFIPCVEPEIKGEEAFIPKDPEILLNEGKFNRVPMIMGLTSHEGILVLRDIISDPSLLDAIDGDFERLVPENLQPAKKDLRISRQLSEKIKDFYFGSESISEETIHKFVDLMSDVYFGIEIDKALKKHVTVAPNVPVYFYQFSFDGELNHAKNMTLQGKYNLKGACHADELGYIFRQYLSDAKFPPDSPEMVTLRRMTKMWTNFAKTGNPTPNTDEDIPVVWKPYTVANPCHLKVDNELVLGSYCEKDRMDFWDMLYRVNK
ncbi:esterase B1 [Anabrus simplex]|uniref:esterase B1 n=1 Tax=Anabrus simplex TaxID=316456 RepID=UPI0035A2717B